jgi:hypothetical protein
MSIPTRHFHALRDGASRSTLPTAPAELAPHASLVRRSRAHIGLVKQRPDGQLGFERLAAHLGFERLVARLGFERLIARLSFECLVARLGFEHLVTRLGR